MKDRLWSWQCHSCYGTHKEIVLSKTKPVKSPVKCSYCNDVMQVYELGIGFMVNPAVIHPAPNQSDALGYAF